MLINSTCSRRPCWKDECYDHPSSCSMTLLCLPFTPPAPCAMASVPQTPWSSARAVEATCSLLAPVFFPAYPSPPPQEVSLPGRQPLE